MAVQDVRVAAINVLLQMDTGGGSLTKLLPTAQQQVAESERALLQALCFGMARWSGRLSGLVDSLLSKPLKRKDKDIYLLLQLGVFQLAYTRIAPHAAVDKTVAATKKLGKPWAKGLVNAVLRNYQRRGDALLELLDEPSSLSHPAWLLLQLKKDWPAQWPSIVAQANLQAPMTLRVNQRLTCRDDYLQSLEAAGINASAVAGLDAAITLNAPLAVHSLPGFMQGLVSVQDAAAQLAALVLGEADGKRLLDACAAPGGKTVHALELGHWQHVVALDHDAQRLASVNDTLVRLQISDGVELHCADASDTQSWWDGTPFDVILLDAPCSGTGVIRRHPDIKLLRREHDIQTLVAVQRKILSALWQTLSPGGRLVYATCSVLKDENERQIRWFLQQQKDAKAQELVLPVGSLRAPGQVQILPGEHGMDGFFYACLAKA